MDDRLRERLFGAVGTALILGAIGAGLVLGLGVDVARLAEMPTRLVTLALPPPPPPPRIEPPPPHRAAAAKAPAPAAPKARATPMSPPPPIVRLAPPPPIVVAPLPDTGAAARAGAGRAGDGQGAGGRGRGTGGGYGDGDGGAAPEQVRGALDYADMPAELRAAGTGAAVGVRYAVEVDGHVADCAVTRSSGMPLLDAITCRLIERRFRFRPARDEEGRPVRSVVIERHVWTVDREPPDDR